MRNFWFNVGCWGEFCGVGGFGCGRAERVPPHRADIGEPNADDPEGGAGYLTSIRNFR